MEMQKGQTLSHEHTQLAVRVCCTCDDHRGLETQDKGEALSVTIHLNTLSLCQGSLLV